MALLTSSLKSAAEDIVQIAPVVTFAGATENDEQCLEVQMVNDTYDEVGVVSFDLLLPEGMHFLYEDFEGDRVPFTKKGKNISYDFSLFEPALQESGFTRYLLVPGGELRPITGKSGTFMYLYFETDASMAPGVYPILIQETVIGKSETEGLYPKLSASYVVVKAAADAENPLTTAADLNLSGMTGYWPSFVVEALNTDLAANTNLRSVNVSGTTEFGAELTVPENVVWQTATKGGLSRTFPAGQWSTVCLPFALSAEQVSAVKDKGCEIEQLSGFTEATSIVSFETATTMAANTPYIVKSNTAQQLFDGLEGVTIGDMSATTDIAKGKLTMKGTYELETLNSDASNTYYVYNAVDGNFVRVGSNATVKPFRAYMAVSGAGARVLNFSDGATGIVETPCLNNDGEVAVDKIYTLQGVNVKAATKGMYISKGKKYVVR